MNYIRCTECKYVKKDEFSSTKGWTALRCDNKDSDYYFCLLNITKNGDKNFHITWTGCEQGRNR